jgi:hypothetical protein
MMVALTRDVPMRNTSKRILQAGCAFVAFSMAGSAQAAITVYTNQAAFLAAVSAPGVDTFTSLSITGSTPSPISRSAGAYNYQGTVSTTSFFGAGTNANPWLSTNTATDTMLFNSFSGGVQAAGGNFFGSNISGGFEAGNVTLRATDAGGSVMQTIVGANPTSFLGFVSDGLLTSLSISADQPAAGFLWPTVDNLTLARAAVMGPGVPEPATWAMMLAGFGLAGSAVRRRQRAARVKLSYS